MKYLRHVTSVFRRVIRLILPQSRAVNAAMRTMAVILALALTTIAFEIYSDAALTRAEVSRTAAPDPVTAAVAHALKHG